MNIIDLIFLFPLGFFIIKGFRKGVILELFSFLALILGIIGSMKLTHLIISSLQKHLTNAEWVPYLAYLFVFIGIYILVRYLGKFFEKVVKNSNMGFFNKLAGGIFGALKILFLFSILIWLTDQINIIPQNVKETSISYKYIQPFAPLVINFINKVIPIGRDIIDQIENFFDQVIENIPENDLETI